MSREALTGRCSVWPGPGKLAEWAGLRTLAPEEDAVCGSTANRFAATMPAGWGGTPRDQYLL